MFWSMDQVHSAGLCSADGMVRKRPLPGRVQAKTRHVIADRDPVRRPLSALYAATTPVGPQRPTGSVAAAAATINTSWPGGKPLASPPCAQSDKRLTEAPEERRRRAVYQG